LKEKGLKRLPKASVHGKREETLENAKILREDPHRTRPWGPIGGVIPQGNFQGRKKKKKCPGWKVFFRMKHGWETLWEGNLA